MATNTITRQFANTIINTVDGNGNVLDNTNTGITIELNLFDGKPVYAEVYDTKTGGQNQYVEIRLTFCDGELVDYDGIFEIPHDLVKMIEDLGFKVCI